MVYETVCELLVKRDGQIVLDESGARLLDMVDSVGVLTAIAKRMGLTMGDIAGAIDSLNEHADAPLIALNEMESELTAHGRELLGLYHLRKKVLDDQMQNLWKKPWLSVDGIIVIDGKIVLIERGHEPFKGKFVLPGGIVEYGERVEDCVVREMKEETGLDTRVIALSGVYSEPDRDPRGHFITIAFNLDVIGGKLVAGDDAAGVHLFEVDDLPEMATDHRKILADALRQRPSL